MAATRNKTSKKAKKADQMFKNMPKKGTEMADERKPCIFCKTCTKNKYQLGRMITKDDICCHYYCILFAPGLQQNGRTTEGIKGFLVDDIKKEVRRGSFLRCTYCDGKGATIGCAIKECPVKFHLPCGIINKSFHDFHHMSGSFPSYCQLHRRNQSSARLTAKHTTGDDKICMVCRESVTTQPTPSTLASPCCGYWYHRECLQKQAYHAGEHHFKCPNCANKDKFVREMKLYGVHVPERDASWERRNEFAYLYQRNFRCGANKCVCSKGREHNGDGRWEILVCDGCGANCTHVRCSGLADDVVQWHCEVCKPVVNKKPPLSQSN